MAKSGGEESEGPSPEGRINGKEKPSCEEQNEMTAEAACEQTSIREGVFGYGGGCARGSEYICGPGDVAWKFSSLRSPP